MDRKNKRRLKPSDGIFYPPPNLKTTTKPYTACPHLAAAPTYPHSVGSLPETAKAAPFRHYGAVSHIKTRQK
ncbi:hypothetical protein [Neisseria gonorrhoeae]|uniref:hypothetical protein n=1 Tax=Neisseria gonorrhoeae TaxID=485 RepID=UPI0021C013DA|nr:hypothetical protein [Neisseria gonorrhoeae]